jgi:hypothetical protein
MLVITNKQLDSLSDKKRREFNNEMCLHLIKHFHDRVTALLPNELPKKIEIGIKNAQQHGFVFKQHVCRYLNLCAYYGWEFDTDPRLISMQELLYDKSLQCPDERLSRLVNSAIALQEEAENNAQLNKEFGR